MTHKNNKQRFWINLCSLAIVFAIMASVSLVTTGKLFGHKPGAPSAPDAVSLSDSGRMVINTTEIGKDVMGYAGPVPVAIYITAGRVDSIQALPNSETGHFFQRVIDSGVLKQWQGKSIPEAIATKADAVSGATYSSTALIQNVQMGLEFAAKSDSAAVAKKSNDGETVKFIFAIIVALSAAILPLFIKNKKYRIAQQFLNVGVLGFWAGCFVDYAMMINAMSNGISITLATITPVILLTVAFLYPLFGRADHYCAWVCPLGSLQDLAGHLCKKKPRMKPEVAKGLYWFRNILWVALLVFLWTGFLSAWMDYELFTAFIVKSASVWVLGAGAAIILLSVWIPRPYCRFLCPTGTLMRKAENAGSL